MAELNFNANDVEPNAPFEAIPAGKYAACIVDSEMKENSAKTGKYLQIKLQVTQGPHKNRVLFDRLNLQNPNDQAVEIAKRTLSAICRSVGVMTPKDSSELHNRPLQVTVAVTEYKGNPKNEVKGYARLDGKDISDGVLRPQPKPNDQAAASPFA